MTSFVAAEWNGFFFRAEGEHHYAKVSDIFVGFNKLDLTELRKECVKPNNTVWVRIDLVQTIQDFLSENSSEADGLDACTLLGASELRDTLRKLANAIDQAIRASAHKIGDNL